MNQQHHLDVRLQVELAALKASLYLYPLYIIKLPEKYLHDDLKCLEKYLFCNLGANLGTFHHLKCVDVTECDNLFRGRATELVKDIVVNA